VMLVGKTLYFAGGSLSSDSTSPLETAVIVGDSRLTCAAHRRNTRSREAMTGLITRGVLGHFDGWVWIAF
jgi:hypothetical protein